MPEDALILLVVYLVAVLSHRQEIQIEYITIATQGNAVDIGDLTVGRATVKACSSSIRGLFGGGQNPSQLTTIDYVEFATIGDAVDFGDLTGSRGHSPSGVSNAHGGL